MTQTEFLLLSGSPRGKVSTSYSILEYLQVQLETLGNQSEIYMIHKVLRNEDVTKKIQGMLNTASYVILASPLYVDSLPSHVIRFLETIAIGRTKTNTGASPKFIAIINSGFPESSHNNLALDICKQFSQEAKLEWKGGIPFGGGAIIDGTPLERAGFRGRHVRPAIKLLAEALSNDQGIPNSAIERINKGVIPESLYIRASEMRWSRIAKKKDIVNLEAQPYKRNE